MSFKQNMLRGLGKCHIDILKSNNREIFREDILYGALNPISYDIYYEGTKCWYIYDLILGMRDNDYFEDIATFSLYLFSMDYTNKVLKSMPNDDKKDILIKSISDNISRGLAALNMYIANDINSSMYKSQVEKTKKTLGISENFHKTFNDYLNFRKPEIIENLINL